MQDVRNTFSWKEVHDAFSNEDISFEQLMEVLVDNLGWKATKKILKHNVRKAEKMEIKHGKRFGRDEILSSSGEDSDASLHD